MSSLLTAVSLVIALVSFLRVLECAAPEVSPSDSGHSLVTTSAETAKTTALCHVACLNFLFENPTDGNETTEQPPSETTTNETVRLQY